MNLPGYVREARRAEIAQEAQLAAGAGFADGNDVEPSVIVVVYRGNSPPALPAKVGQSNTLEALAFNITPQTDARRAGVRPKRLESLFCSSSISLDGSQRVITFIFSYVLSVLTQR